jgi:hypothetical protein
MEVRGKPEWLEESWKRTKLEDSHFTISEVPTKL